MQVNGTYLHLRILQAEGNAHHPKKVQMALLRKCRTFLPPEAAIEKGWGRTRGICVADRNAKFTWSQCDHSLISFFSYTDSSCSG